MNTITQKLLSEEKQQERIVKGYNVYINGHVKRLNSQEIEVYNPKNGHKNTVLDSQELGLVCKCEDQQYRLEFGIFGDRCYHVVACEYLLMEEMGIGA